jgi:ribosomal protein L29
VVVNLDTLKIARRLKEAGLDERQAETITDVLRESRELDFSLLATKADLAELRNATKADLAELRNATKADLAELRNATKADLAELRNATKAELAELRSDMDLRLTSLQAEIDRRFAAVEAKIAVLQAEIASLKWMVGGVGFGIHLLVVRSFWPAGG